MEGSTRYLATIKSRPTVNLFPILVHIRHRRGVIFVLFHRDLRSETIINEHPVQTCFVRDCSIPIVYFSLKSNKKNSIPVFHRWAFSTRLNLMYFFYHKMTQQLCPPKRQQKKYIYSTDRRKKSEFFHTEFSLRF